LAQAAMLGLPALALALLSAAAPTALELTDASFEAAKKEHAHLLVLFYAPWCGHCRQLMPDFERAAVTLKSGTPVVQLAQVDATAETDLAEQYQIRGYPTLKFLTEGKALDYTGGRTTESLVAWTMKKVGPAAHPVENVDAFVKENSICVIAFVEDESWLEKYMTVARETEDIVFGFSLDAGAAKARGVARPGVQMYFPHNAGSATFGAEFADAEQLHAFIGTYRLPMVVPFDGDVAPVLFADSRPILFVFTEQGKGDTAEEKALHAAAPSLLGKVLMSTAGSFEPMDQRLLDYVGVDSEKDLPAARLVVDPAGPLRKYRLDGEITAESLQKFVARHAAGELKVDLKSEAIPVQSGPVYELVGLSFPEQVIAADKDALVFFYAPWCGHCKKFEPVYKELAAKLSSVSNSLLVARIDATKNDVEGVDVTGFPSLFLYRNGKKDQPLTYDGERDVTSIVQWLKDTGGLSFKEEL